MSSNSEKPIGVFDSGIGGLTVLKSLIEKLPHENTVYLGDTARLPYGTKSAEVVTQYSLKNAQKLLEHDIKMLVVACNTASAVALPALQSKMPVPVIGVIEPGSAAAVKTTRTNRIAVIGTPGTVASGAYERAIRALSSDIKIIMQACPLFVPLAEEGWVDGEVPTLVARKYLAALKGQNIDTLVLGCTHYPLLRAIIAQELGEKVALVDSGEAASSAVIDALRNGNLFRAAGSVPTRRFLVTDAPHRFVEVGSRFLGQTIDHAEQVDLSFGV